MDAVGENKKLRIVKIIIGFALAILFLLPIYMLATASFKTQKGIFIDPIGLPTQDTLSLTNYLDAISRMDYPTALWNSLWITTVSTLVIVLCTSRCV